MFPITSRSRLGLFLLGSLLSIASIAAQDCPATARAGTLAAQSCVSRLPFSVSLVLIPRHKQASTRTWDSDLLMPQRGILSRLVS